MADNNTLLRAQLAGIYGEISCFQPCENGYRDDGVLKILALADDRTSEQALTEILQDEAENKYTRLMAFYALCTRFRRLKNYSSFRRLIDTYAKLFGGEAIYRIQSVYFLSSSSKPSELAKNLKQAYVGWQDIRHDYPEYCAMPAFIQIYTETIALCFENRVQIVEEKDRIPLLQQAIELLRMANRIREYPKFYATIGRLQFCLRLYDEALDSYQEAIDKEDSNRSEYQIRISDYRIEQSKIERERDEHRQSGQNFTLFDESQTKPVSYEGAQPFIFFSYCHRDGSVALQIIHRLQVEGFRVWYDEGIKPGMDWPDTIAKHLNVCCCFIALISEDYIRSQNCLDELHYIIDRYSSGDSERNYFPIYRENIVLKDGLKLRLGRQQALMMDHSAYQEHDFYQRLFEVGMLQPARQSAQEEKA